ncbi:cyclic peptide export ABC transporter [Fulvivirga sp. 29W222]|uniref:Cyclic peptide export ABC transporter n=1 Tax=Fulvivirga marina TaxID=2494733 RepID=A0A937G1E4_9BACT|nr:cyclic peptide export ABC transporter [Fulvivirga marina]MBL6448215.1 cyclic peptide export ABC transporter [Fulvivirga marina]
MIKIKMIICVLVAVWSTNVLLAQSDDLDRVLAEAEVIALMDEGDIPGMSIVIVKDGKPFIRTFGYSDLEAEKKVTPATLFELGSCSKAFTAMAVTQLAEQGKIDLDKSVSDYLPWFKVSYEEAPQTITIEQLLHHTSGIPWNTIAKIPETTDDDALESTVKQLIGEELDEIPGTNYEYATINYDVLALIVQEVSGQSFENYLQHNIIDKLGLDNTTVGNPLDTNVMAVGYKIGFFVPQVYDAPVYRGNYAAGYVISNANDMAKWLTFQMGQGDSSMYALARLTHLRDKTVPLHNMASYARGWHVKLDGSDEILHEGANPNFTSYVAFRPDEKMGVAVLANSNSKYTPVIGHKILKAMAGEEIAREFDPGDGNDKVYSSISLTLVLYIFIVIGFTVMGIRAIFKGERAYIPLTWSKVGKFLKALLLIVPFLFAFYILPQAIAGFTWEAILVWSPVSFAALIILVLTAMAVSYLAYFFTLCFPLKNQYLGKVPVILLMSILSGLSNVILIVMVTSAIGSDIELRYIVFYYALILGVYLLGRRFVQVNLIRFARGLVYDLRIELIDKIFSTSYQKFESMDRGRVYTALNDDVNYIGESTNVFATLITSIITAAGAFIYLASIAFWATLLTIFLILALSAIYFFVGKSTNVYYENARDERNVFMRLINGMIDGFKEISLHRNKKLAYKEDVAISAEQYKKKISTADIRFVNAFLVGESLLVVLLGVVAFGMPEMFPHIELYVLMSFVVILLYLIGPINAILGAMPAMMQLKVAWNRLKHFREEIPANLDLSALPAPRPPEVKSIKIRQVSFSYKKENKDEQFSVGPIDMEAYAGEILFLIGGNGSGKTTFAKLLTGLYTPDQGELMINDEVVDSAEVSEYFSTVFSPAHLFEKLYSQNVTDREEEVNKLLKLLQLDHKVVIKENTYNTIELSGGQRKRLALFQCYLEDSPIYLFDEWAADQDPEYRKFFYRTLLPEMRKMGKIIVAITHDDHYFDVADRIYKMNQGKLEPYKTEETMAC